MKKLLYLVLVLITIANVPSWGQKTWNQKAKDEISFPASRKVLPGTREKQSSPYSPEGIQTDCKSPKSVPNLSIQRNPFKTFPLTTVEGKEMYGYSMRNEDTFDEQGFFKFNSSDPAAITHIGTFTKSVRSGAEANGIYYAIALYQGYPEGFYTVDLTTGEMTLVADYMYNETVRGGIDMSYDYTTETMYFITNSDKTSNTALRTVNLTDGTQQVISEDMGLYFRTLAINLDGEMYGIDREANLYKINKENGTSTLIGATGINLFFWQCMEFDRGTGILYWASFTTNDISTLCTVDLTNGGVTPIGVIGKNEQVVGLYIPFEMCAPEAPAAVADFTVTPDAKGEKKAVISWKNPEQTYEGKTLASINKVELLRNGEVITTLTNVQPGETSVYTDQVSEAGKYSYKLLAYNTAGAGAPKTSNTYIGHDIPSAVNNAVATRTDDKTIAIKWDAVTTGVNKGYLDLSSIRYKITRNDGKTVAQELKETTYTDPTIETLGRYTYDIEVSNADGSGGITTTNYVVTGPVQQVPFIADFANEENADLWTTVDNNNDDLTFSLLYNYRLNVTEYAYYTSFKLQADDWLVSPVITFEGNKHYKIIVNAKRSAEWAPELFSIYLVKNMNVADSIKLDEFEVSNFDAMPFRVNMEGIEGEYSVAVRCISAPLSDYFTVTNVSIEENHDGNIRGDIYDEQDNPVMGAIVVADGTDFSAKTDKDGVFEIKNIPAGDYTLKCSKLGYWDSTLPVTVKELESKNVELDMTARNAYKVTGTVTNEYGEALPTTKIIVSGYNTYKASTDKDGKFTITGVYEATEAYQVKAEKLFYQEFSKEATISKSDIDLTFTLKDKILPPAYAQASLPGGASLPEIVWTKPGEDAAINYHSDQYNHTFGTEEGDSKVLYGLLCKEPFLIEKMNWGIVLEDAEINVVVLALDETGKVTSEILYIDEHATNVPWGGITTYEFLSPVATPQGCFIGISCNEGSINMMTVGNTEKYPFVEGINGYIENYTNPELNFVEELGDDYRENFYINFEGKCLAGEEAPSPTYNVYRRNPANEESLLTVSPVSKFILTDTEWNTLNEGDYGYEIEAVYRNHGVSERIATNKLTKTFSAINEIKTGNCYAKVSPDGNSILFSSEMEEIQLLSIDGKIKIETGKTDAVDIKTVDTGIYIIKMKKGGEQRIQKIILKK